MRRRLSQMFSSPLHPNYPLGTVSSNRSRSRREVQTALGIGITTIDKENCDGGRQKTHLAGGTPESPLGDITESSFLNARYRNEQSSTPKQLLTPDPTPPLKRHKKTRSPLEVNYSNSLISSAVLQPGTALTPSSLPLRLFVREISLRPFGSRRFYSRADFSKYELQTYYSTAVDDAYAIQESTGLRHSIPFSVTSCRHHAVSAVGGEDGIVHILDTDAAGPAFQLPIMKLACHDNAIFDLSFSPTDTHLATASGDQTARIFDLQRQQCTSILRPCDAHSVKQVKFEDTPSSRNPAIIATSTRGGTISLFDTRVRKGGSAEIYPVAQIMRAQNPEKGRRATKSTPARSVTSLEFLDDTTLLSAGEASGSCRMWDLRKASLERKYLQPYAQTVGGDKDHGVTSIAVDFAGARLWTMSKSGGLFAYPLTGRDQCEPMECVRDPRLKVDSFYVKMSVASEEAIQNAGLNGRYIACGSSENAVVVVPLSRPGCDDLIYMPSPRSKGSQYEQKRVAAALVNGHSKEVTGVSWTCNGEIMSIGDDMLVRRWLPHRDPSKSERIREAMMPRRDRDEIIPEDEMDGYAVYDG
ncbi:WD40-repeat-containing domain protein [Lipomyces tetrasporus]